MWEWRKRTSYSLVVYFSGLTNDLLRFVVSWTGHSKDPPLFRNLFGPANICIEHELHGDFDKKREFWLPLLYYPNTNFIDNILKSFTFVFISVIKFLRVGWYLPTAYVVRGKVMFWHVSVHPSICLSTPRGYPSQVQLGGGGGGTPTRSSQGYPNPGGTPPQVPPGQTCPGGYPIRPAQVGTLMGRGTHLGYPLSNLARGTLMGVPWGVSDLGYPPQTWPGVPQWGYSIGPGQGIPQWGGGVCHLGYPPSDLAGGYPDGGYPTSGTPLSNLVGGYPNGGVPTSGSTWYAAVGMPLAFTQEDFLVILLFLAFTYV